MICKNDIANLKTDILDKVGQKIIVKGSLGRSKAFEKEATIEKVYPNIFVVKYEENDRNVVEVFLKLYEYGTDLNKELDKEVIKKLLVEILYLSKLLGFTLEDLKKETKRKSLVIQKRLNSDY